MILGGSKPYDGAYQSQPREGKMRKEEPKMKIKKRLGDLEPETVQKFD